MNFYLEQTPQPLGLFDVLIGDDVHNALPFWFETEMMRNGGVSIQCLRFDAAATPPPRTRTHARAHSVPPSEDVALLQLGILLDEQFSHARACRLEFD
jgi:hypothetical protein